VDFFKFVAVGFGAVVSAFIVLQLLGITVAPIVFGLISLAACSGYAIGRGRD
jgi:hypothetical protein